MADRTQMMKEKLVLLYGNEKGEELLGELTSLLNSYTQRIPKRSFDFSHRDVVLITYGDSFRSANEKPLLTLKQFLDRYGQNIISTVHILPFFPYSSDDGFSVIDYKRVDPALGSWSHIREIAESFQLMFDLVINHVSAQSTEFQEFLNGNESYDDYFIVAGPETDTSRVFRPRTLPLLTRVTTKRGERLLWTTFSPDQIDLNFKNPRVLLWIIDVLLFYISNGASVIRLDAIAYLWKESGTNCLHLPQTHTVVKLFRDVLEQLAPHVKILTETNVPHRENISYFGSGKDEAHMVYNFALPPLTAYALLSGDATPLTLWAGTLSFPSPKTYMYNFTSSHDGIGVLPARDLLTNDQVALLLRETEKRGGRVSSKLNADGSTSPYELNISLFDLISDPDRKESLMRKVDRFIASQAIALSLKGVPALYYHSLMGSRNYHEGVEHTKAARAINREKLDYDRLGEELETAGSIRNLVYYRLARLIEVRREQRAFHPGGEQKILNLHTALFACDRYSPDGKERVTSLINVSENPVKLTTDGSWGSDLVSGRKFKDTVTVLPYEILWLRRSPRS